MRRVLLWLPPLLYMAVIFYLSSQPAPLPALTGHVWDKALHFTEYTVLCALLCRALHGEGLATLRVALLGLLLTSAYGASDEVRSRIALGVYGGQPIWADYATVGRGYIARLLTK